jgi:hypothetical protein
LAVARKTAYKKQRKTSVASHIIKDRFFGAFWRAAFQDARFLLNESHLVNVF